MKKIWGGIKEFFKEFGILLRSLPPLMLALFVLSIVAMNLLANKSIDLPVNWLALDAGITLSWLSFLTMDIITKRFGPKAGIMVSILGLVINLGFALIFFIISIIPGFWGESFTADGIDMVVNTALDKTFRGTWYVLLGSSIAFAVSAVVNCLLNFAIGLGFKKKPDSFFAFALRSYVSTAIAQFIDNLLFAFIVSHVFFGWTTLQCITCALTGMVLELLFEVIFSPIGYAALKCMQKNGTGQEYLDYRLARKNNK